MQNTKFYIHFALLFCILLTNACSDDNLDNSDAGQGAYAEEVAAYFQIQLNEGKNLRSSYLTLNGTPAENKINTLTFFIVDLKDDGELDWTWVKRASILAPSNLSNIKVSIKTNTGNKHVFVGANMSAAQISSFCINRGQYTAVGNTYKDIVSNFADSLGHGFVMFGQMKMQGTESSVIKVDGGENIISTKANLDRVVSKVALTYTPTSDPSDTNEKHVTIGNGIGGFIDADSVYFMLNATSKSINFLGTSPRYTMSDYIKHNTDPDYQTLYHYQMDPTNHFVIYTPQGLVPGEVNLINTYPTETIKLPTDMLLGDNPYRQGLSKPHDAGLDTDPKPEWHSYSSLYCLENTVNSTGIDFGSEQSTLKELRKGINTHVIVAAKYIPGMIYHYSAPDTDYTPIVLHADDGNDKLLEITSNNGDANGPYTFYAVLQEPVATPAKYDYYTYDAKKFLDGKGNPPNFIAYKGAYGYYSTFVTQDPLAKDEDYDLERNNFYVLNVKEFTPPGAVYPQQVYMLINSQTVDWEVQKAINVPLD